MLTELDSLKAQVAELAALRPLASSHREATERMQFELLRAQDAHAQLRQKLVHQGGRIRILIGRLHGSRALRSRRRAAPSQKQQAPLAEQAVRLSEAKHKAQVYHQAKQQAADLNAEATRKKEQEAQAVLAEPCSLRAQAAKQDAMQAQATRQAEAADILQQEFLQVRQQLADEQGKHRILTLRLRSCEESCDWLSTKMKAHCNLFPATAARRVARNQAVMDLAREGIL